MKLTFAKAEHLKRNATKAEDPKAVFQAMRPVFNELLGEVQRSIGFFQNLDRTAKIGRVVALGNAMKLPGLHKYLSQNLGLEVSEFEDYRQLDGPAVTTAPVFKENMLSYPVCYGLAVQALDKAKLSTNLLPPEIMKDRMIRAKKPWAVAAVAALLLGCILGYFGKWREWNSARPDDRFNRAFFSAKSAEELSKADQTAYEEAKSKYEQVQGLGKAIAGIGERRILVGEMLKAVTDALPHDDKEQPDIASRNEVHIDTVEMEHFADLKTWYDEVRDLIAETPKAGGAGKGDVAKEGEGGAVAAAPDAGPSGPGWVVQLAGYHYHNKNKEGFVQGAEFVRRTLIESLKNKKDIDLPGGKFSMKELGIEDPVLVSKITKVKPETVTDPNVTDSSAAGAVRGGVGGKASRPGSVDLERFDFVVQFAWKPTTLSERLAHREQAKEPPHELATADGGSKQ